MNIKYSKKKEELRHDAFLENVQKGWNFTRKHSNQLLVAVGVILVVVFTIQLFSYTTKKNIQKAEEAFGKALILYRGQNEAKAIDAFKLVIEQNKNSLHAGYSAFYLGNIALKNSQYDQAIQYFEKVAESSKDLQFVKGEALKAIGICYEIKGNNAKAIEYLERALKEKEITFDHSSIQWKLALLYQKGGESAKAIKSCESIIADTLSTGYKQEAQNLLTVLNQ